MKKGRTLLALSIVILVLFGSASCGLSSHHERAATTTSKTDIPTSTELPASSGTPPSSERLSGDESLPPLDGEYSYVLAKVLAKDRPGDRLEVEIVAWNNPASFAKSLLEEGLHGYVTCEQLGIFPGGIQDGSTVVIASSDSDTRSLPLSAVSVEQLGLFEERVERWVAQP